MPANKKSANTSKTAHVMNLLSKNRDRQPTPSSEEAPAAEKQEKQSAPEAAPTLPPVMSSLNLEAAVSAQIKSALETTLEQDAAGDSHPEETPSPAAEETAQAVPAPEEPSPQVEAPPTEEEIPSQTPSLSQGESPVLPDEEAAEAAVQRSLEEELALALEESQRDLEPVPETEPVAESLPLEEAAPMPSAEKETLPEPVEEPQPPSPPQETDKPVPSPAVLEEAQNAAAPDLVCLNVIEALVAEKADKYIEMFGLCSCPRCSMEVKALALTNLPSLYVVIPSTEVNFRLAIYEPRYSATITAQLVHACKVVMENPRHGDGEPATDS